METTLKLRSEHIADLQRSGLSDEIIEAAGIRSVKAKEAKEVLGFDPKSDGWVIPYPHRNGLPDLLHFKPDSPYPDSEGKLRKYLFPKGARSRIYIPPMISMEALQNKRIPLYIVEGEKKALKAAQEGLVCIAIPGVWNWKYRDENGDSRTIPDLFDVWLEGREIFICFDSDIVSKSGVARAEFELAQKLRLKGAKVSGVRLPTGADGEKVGLDDYLLQHSVSELRSLNRDPLDSPPDFSKEKRRATEELEPDPWPVMEEEAYHGLAGEIVKAIEPYTEADPAGLLVSFLAEFGCIIGRSPHLWIDGSYHPLLVYPVLVGKSSKARKGSSGKRIKALFGAVNPTWTRGSYKGSLSSGEGLAYAVRDAEFKAGKDGEQVLIDEGVTDKRLFLVQSEFGSVLKIMAREGNSLSGVIRDAWDGEDLCPMTKNNRS